MDHASSTCFTFKLLEQTYATTLTFGDGTVGDVSFQMQFPSTRVEMEHSIRRRVSGIPSYRHRTLELYQVDGKSGGAQVEHRNVGRINDLVLHLTVCSFGQILMAQGITILLGMTNYPYTVFTQNWPVKLVKVPPFQRRNTHSAR